MKTFTKFFKIIAIVAVIALGFNACASTAEKYEAAIKTPEGKAFQESMQKAKWKAKALSAEPDLGFVNKLPEWHIAYVHLSTAGPKMNANTWYELTAPEFPGISYYSYEKIKNDKSVFDIYVQDEKLVTLRKTLENASWNVKSLGAKPSLDGFIRVSREERDYFHKAGGNGLYKEGETRRGSTTTIKNNGVERTIKYIGLNDNAWYALTAPEFPGITYYYYSHLDLSVEGKSASSYGIGLAAGLVKGALSDANDVIPNSVNVWKNNK